jgi:hypothetical protein
MSENGNGRAIDKVRAAFSRALRPLEIPEWGLTLYFGPLTVAEMEAVEKRQPKTPYERNLFLLVSAARDADGKPVFQQTDIYTLQTEATIEVIGRIIAFMWKDDSGQGAAKELGEGQTSSGASLLPAN